MVRGQPQNFASAIFYNLTGNTETHRFFLFYWASLAAATAAWPRLNPPSLGGTSRLV